MRMDTPEDFAALFQRESTFVDRNVLVVPFKGIPCTAIILKNRGTFKGKLKVAPSEEINIFLFFPLMVCPVSDSKLK